MAAVNLLTAMLLFLIADPRINEASGIAASIVDPRVVYVQNDSGDAPRFFALDARTGRTVAMHPVPGATNVDWEDLAVARDRRGVASVWLADIGDNDARRADVCIYRVDEPRPGTAVGRPEVWRLRYPDGPHDAESLAVAPGGAAFIVTKSLLGSSAVYTVPARPGGVQTLRKIGEIRFALTGPRAVPTSSASSPRPAQHSPGTARCSPSVLTPTRTCGGSRTVTWRRRCAPHRYGCRCRPNRRVRASP
jgi:hypothetical protein